MKPADDILATSLALLSTGNLDELTQRLAGILSDKLKAEAVAVAMWDSDLESFADRFVYGEKQAALTRFLDIHLDDAELADRLAACSLTKIEQGEAADGSLKEIEPVMAYAVRRSDNQLLSLILIAGPRGEKESEIYGLLSLYPLADSFGHSWELLELKRENERLRERYEDLEHRNVLLEEEIRKVLHNLEAKDRLRTSKIEQDRLLYEISNFVRSSVKIKEVLERSVSRIGSVFGVSHCLLLRPVRGVPDSIEVFEYCQNSAQSIKDQFLTDDGLEFISIAMRKSAPQVLSGPGEAESGAYNGEFLRRLAFRTGVIIPLVLRESSLGVIFLQEHQADREWTIDTTAFLGSLADQLSLAIENAELHEERERQAVTDPLTGVANRRHFNEIFWHEFERARRYSEPLSLILVDLDYLKRINDTLGHKAGDEAIKRVAEIMQASSRSVDLPARYGGEEFCLLLPNTDVDMAVQTAERLRKLINQCVIEGCGALSASIGVASYPSHGEDSDTLFHRADEALYQAKQEGRNRVCVAGGSSIEA